MALSASVCVVAWLQSDGQQNRTIAQLALNLVYKLLKGQMDQSDGPDAPYNYSFLLAIGLQTNAAHSIIRMCKRGSLGTRHAALAVLKQCMINRHGQDFIHTMQERLISLGLMPLLFGIVQAPESTVEMRTMADACLGSLHSNHNAAMASYGTNCLMARLIALSVSERRAAANSDRHN